MELGEMKYRVGRDYIYDPRKIGSILLYQVGRGYCTPGGVVPIHSHRDYVEFTVVTGGGGVVTTNGHPTRVGVGDVYVSFAGDFHEIVSDVDSPLKYDFTAIYTTDESMLSSIAQIQRDFHSPESRVIRNDKIRSVLSGAIAEISAGEQMSDVILESMFRQLLAYMIRSFHSVKPVRYSSEAVDAESLCYQVMNYIDTHIYTMKSLSEVAAELSYNYNYLSNLYKRTTGDTVMSYYRDRRLEAARLLLLEGRATVTAVASALGYSSLYTFSRAFKEKFGVPPTKVAHAVTSDRNNTAKNGND